MQGDDGLVFEWDDQKAEKNLIKHDIDFDDAIGIFEGDVILTPSPYANEDRFAAVGLTRGSVITVIYTMRGEVIRIISARAARRNERRNYHAHFPGEPP